MVNFIDSGQANAPFFHEADFRAIRAITIKFALSNENIAGGLFIVHQDGEKTVLLYTKEEVDKLAPLELRLVRNAQFVCATGVQIEGASKTVRLVAIEPPGVFRIFEAVVNTAASYDAPDGATILRDLTVRPSAEDAQRNRSTDPLLNLLYLAIHKEKS